MLRSVHFPLGFLSTFCSCFSVSQEKSYCLIKVSMYRGLVNKHVCTATTSRECYHSPLNEPNMKICYIILPQIIRPDLAVLLLDWFSKLSSSNDILLITNFSRENGLKFLNYQARPCGFSSNRNSRKSTSYTRCNGGILLIFRQKFCDFLKTHVV